MLTVTIDQSEGISEADIPEQAAKKMRTGSAAPSLPSPPACFSRFFLLHDFSPLSRSLEQARKSQNLSHEPNTCLSGSYQGLRNRKNKENGEGDIGRWLTSLTILQ